jgi:hypothetical protein
VYFGPSSAQPQPELGRHSRRRLRFGEIRIKHHLNVHQNQLRKTISFYMRSILIFSAQQNAFKYDSRQAHNKGTFAQALQTECMEVWGVSVGTKIEEPSFS